MKLSRKKAIELCIELWTWLAKTGKKKGDWPKWKKYENYALPKGSAVLHDCWFCEYGYQMTSRSYARKCEYCPLIRKLNMNCGDGKCFYEKWEDVRTPKTRKKYAKLFLEQIKKCT